MPVVSVKDTPQNQQFGPIPPGNYYADIEKSEYKDTKSGGKMVALSVAVGNRKLFTNIVVDHTNKEVAERGRKDVADLLFACNMEDLNSWDDVENFVSKHIMVRVYTQKNKEKGTEDSAIGSFARYDGKHRNGTEMKLGITPSKPSGAKAKNEEDVAF